VAQGVDPEFKPQYCKKKKKKRAGREKVLSDLGKVLNHHTSEEEIKPP
jgi:hypothetical protein